MQEDFPEIDHISLYTLRIYIILGVPMLLSAAYTLSYVFTAGTVSYRFVQSVSSFITFSFLFFLTRPRLTGHRKKFVDGRIYAPFNNITKLPKKG